MQFIGLFLNKQGDSPLYTQLYEFLAKEIQTGKLRYGEKLPGKRTAATQLGVSINTVDQAYQMLAAEGYLLVKPKSGFFVQRLEQGAPAVAPLVVPSAAKQPPSPKPQWIYSFASSGIDTSLFPLTVWNRLFRETLASEDSLLSQGDGMGDFELRSAIAEYLRGFRGVRCEAEQLVVGSGLEQLIGMLGRVKPRQVVAVETPGYSKTKKVLQNVGVPVVTAGVDQHGMLPELLQKSGAHIAYITPSHQFPTGGIMPVGRRTELLRWAYQGGMIIEDDYDSEFRFDGKPLPSLQGLDRKGRVVYAGTFSRSLAPGLRTAYLVLPPEQLFLWREMYGEYSCAVSRPEQHTLARFMAQGHFARSLNRMRAVYKKRRGLVLQALEEFCPSERYTVENIHTGLFMILRFPGCNATQLAEKARGQGIKIRALDEYWHSQPASSGSDALVLGYGGLPEQDIFPAVKKLAGIL